MIFVFFSKKLWINEEQIKECEISFYTFIFEEDNEELKKHDVNGKDNVGFLIPFCREATVFNLLNFKIFVI